MYAQDNQGVMFVRDASNYFQPLVHSLSTYIDDNTYVDNCTARGASGQVQYGSNDVLNNRSLSRITRHSMRIVFADALTSACYDYCIPMDRRIDFRHGRSVNVLLLDGHTASTEKIIGSTEVRFVD